MSRGVAAGGARRPWVFLHGWGFHSGIWSDIASALAPRADVRLLDLPGHGAATERTFPTLDALADRIAEDLPPDATLIGWSLGGLVAQHLARRHPDRVGALVLIAATPCFLARDGWPHGIADTTLAAFAADLRRDVAGTLARFVSLNAVSGSGARDVVRGVTRRLSERPGPSASALDEGLELLRTADLRHEAPAIAQPALVVHGTRDRIVPVEAGRWLARTLPNARLVELPGSAHLPFVSDRAAVLDALERFDG